MTSPDHELSRTLAALAPELAATIEEHPEQTLVPAELDAATGAAVASASRFALHETLGEGGMGVVRLATQHGLERRVAVKTLRPERRDERSVVRLLREAWVTGSLEHPNILPVYDLAQTSDGSPMIVLKRIEGDDWTSLMRDPERVRARFAQEDLLEWNLGVLLQVCNAVAFAHSRRILHRDIKPENVMIGRFGEVYLVDWGIAVGLDGADPRIPPASEAREPAGTPLYMAPEMLGGPNSRLSERTDVYLLGAVLYEIVAGHPPHRGESFMRIVASIAESRPALPEEVPFALERIVRRALHRDRDARFENVEQLRLALRAFLEHRSAARVAERAEERLRELESLVRQPAEDADAQAIHRVFGECRFGLRQALEIWPDDEMTRDALDRAITLVAEHELRAGRPETARAVIAERARASPALSERIEAECRRAVEEREGLRRLSEDLSPTRGSRSRAVAALAMGIAWTALPLAGAVLERVGIIELSNAADAAVALVLVVVVFATGAALRASLLRTAINRRLAFAAVLAIAIQAVDALASELLGRPPHATIHAHLLSDAAVVAMLAVVVHPGLGISAAAFAAAYLVLAWTSLDDVLFVLAGCNLVLVLNVFFLWRRRRRALGAERE